MQTHRELRPGPTRRALPDPVGRVPRYGGAHGNARLTSLVASVLLVLLAVEGATIPWIGPLLSVHVFVGMLLLGPVALKLASVGYRFASYYGRRREYVRLGPPAPLMRFLVGPVLVLSTLTLFGSGVALLVIPERGTILLLHKASFIVWFCAMTLHVLAYALRAGRTLLLDVTARHADGRVVRLALVVGALAVGTGVAVATYSLGDPWFHHLVR
jgi:hypothetical protein